MRCRVVHGPMLRDAKSAATISANPQIAFMVAKHIPHHHPRQLLELVRPRHAVTDLVNSRAHRPKASVAVPRDRRKVRIRAARQRYDMYGRLVEPNQSGL